MGSVGTGGDAKVARAAATGIGIEPRHKHMRGLIVDHERDEVRAERCVQQEHIRRLEVM